jgi:sensor histidine kinase regulating citrate/malate metabolism
VDARQNAAHHKMERTMDGMREGVLLLSSEGRVQLMNCRCRSAFGLAADSRPKAS